MLNENIKKLVATVLKVDPESLNDDSSMDNVPNWDSLRHLNIVLALEDEFKFVIPDEEATVITSLKLINLVVKELIECNG